MWDDNEAHADAQEILSKAKAIADEPGVDAQTLSVTGDPSSVFEELPRNSEETEAARAAAMPAETVQAASIDDLVKEGPVDRAGDDGERELESNIDPQAAAYRDRRND